MRDDERHLGEMAENSIEPIDMLVVNFYPFEEVVAKEGTTFSEAIENIDIGGPAMLRAAAKNHASVSVLTDPEDYGAVLRELRRNKGKNLPRNQFPPLGKGLFLRLEVRRGDIELSLVPRT